MLRRRLQQGIAATLLAAGIAAADAWPVVDPGNPGPDAPPLGRSLFDHLTTDGDRQQIPFPFEALIAGISARLDHGSAYLDRPIKQVLIPFGRSLQRSAAAPAYLTSPRAVVAVDSEPANNGDGITMLLRDRLFIGYLEAADVLEVISYNEAAARFEFQVVTDYRQGGTPQVRYARRVVCLACHQNAAPIFARPLWDETNANATVSAHLLSKGESRYGIAVHQGSDIAYAIDNATDRANGLALTQLLWTQGCGDGVSGQACRRDLLTALLQYALSGERGFVANPGLHRHLDDRRARSWPAGLSLPVSDIPNRKPLRRARLGAALASEEDYPYLADVAGRFEPLNPRPAPPPWVPSGDALAERAVAGLREFMTDAEVARLDRLLGVSDAPFVELETRCDVTESTNVARPQLSLSCHGSDVELRTRLYVDSDDETWSGRARRVRIAGNDLGTLDVVATRSGQRLTLSLSRADGALPVRLFNGDLVHDARLSSSTAVDGRATLSVRIRRDSRSIARLISQYTGDANDALAGGPFVRARVLGPLLANGSGDDPTAGCCATALATTVQLSEQEPPLPRDADLDPFMQVCAGCHRSHEAFPPNFLSGPAARVNAAIAQCAERIQYRLAMWELDAAERPKSPMPPHLNRAGDHGPLSPLRTQLLPGLRAALHRIASRQGRPLQTVDDVERRAYADLRPCLDAG